MMNLENMLNGKSHMQKTARCLVPLIGRAQNRRIPRDVGQLSGAGGGEDSGEGLAEWAQSVSQGGKNTWNLMMALDAQHVKTPKAAESDTLNSKCHSL